MTNAPRDENNIPAKLACLNTDSVQGTNLVPIAITPSGRIKINEVDTVQFTMKSVDPKDENYVNVWLFTGEDGNVYPAVADSDGKLLINQT